MTIFPYIQNYSLRYTPEEVERSLKLLERKSLKIKKKKKVFEKDHNHRWIDRKKQNFFGLLWKLVSSCSSVPIMIEPSQTLQFHTRFSKYTEFAERELYSILLWFFFFFCFSFMTKICSILIYMHLCMPNSCHH